MRKHARLMAFVIAALLFSCLLSACVSDDPDASKTYNFDRDKIPSITSVVGERTLVGTETEGNNEFPSMQYTYQSNSVFDDLSQYTKLLQERGWTVTGGSYDLEETPGSAQFVKESADKGQILVLLISYEKNVYAIKITKLEAALVDLGSNSE